MKKVWRIILIVVCLGGISFAISYFVTSGTAEQRHPSQASVAKHNLNLDSRHPNPSVQQEKPRIYTVKRPTPEQIQQAHAAYQAYLNRLKTVPGKEIGYFHTSLNGDNASGRVQNILLASKLINGTVLLPGQQFSFNRTTGDSNNPANGWKHAIEIVNNKFVMGYGGGICQVSTTMYNAVLQARLRIDERYTHSLPVPYVAHGKDATVDYPLLDFKFTNSLQQPVRIQTFVSGNDVICKIFLLSPQR
ncbi:VanW family protein [Fodinisporobacter ferrooxydans]|uniref:VanW family protein n=1 Tax=Fodinisporobacter ferrooxydans TaxID=2901836 RepID=A0ABY4CH78_9BACL|nr:VanW family protein [Alicyclobacillaceae bacterium MYW30-H2]